MLSFYQPLIVKVVKKWSIVLNGKLVTQHRFLQFVLLFFFYLLCVPLMKILIDWCNVGLHLKTRRQPASSRYSKVPLFQEFMLGVTNDDLNRFIYRASTCHMPRPCGGINPDSEKRISQQNYTKLSIKEITVHEQGHLFRLFDTVFWNFNFFFSGAEDLHLLSHLPICFIYSASIYDVSVSFFVREFTSFPRLVLLCALTLRLNVTRPWDRCCDWTSQR